MRHWLLILLLSGSVASEEVRRLRFEVCRFVGGRIKKAPSAQLLTAFQRFFPEGNYCWDKGRLYVTGDPSELDAIPLPEEWFARWEPVDLKVEKLPFESGCKYNPETYTWDRYPVAKMVGSLQGFYRGVTFVPGTQGRWYVVGEPAAVEAARQVPDAPPPRSFLQVDYGSLESLEPPLFDSVSHPPDRILKVDTTQRTPILESLSFESRRFRLLDGTMYVNDKTGSMEALFTPRVMEYLRRAYPDVRFVELEYGWWRMTGEPTVLDEIEAELPPQVPVLDDASD